MFQATGYGTILEGVSPKCRAKYLLTRVAHSSPMEARLALSCDWFGQYFSLVFIQPESGFCSPISS